MKALDIAELLGLDWKIFAEDPADPYMLRIHLTPHRAWWRRHLPGVALNYFFRGDKGDEYHNHEWRWSFSVPLTNGYTDHRKDGRYAPVRDHIVRPGMLNFIWKDTFHKVTLDDPKRGCWTLFVMAPRDLPDGVDSDWGFTTEDGSEFEHQVARRARVKAERSRA